MREFTVSFELPINCDEFYNLFFRTPEFKERYHVARGDEAIQVTQWTPVPNGRHQRIIKFQSSISNNQFIQNLVGASSAIKEIQLLHWKNEELLVNTTTFVSGGIGEQFDCRTEIRVSSVLGGSRCDIRAKTEYKGMLFKGTIEGFAHDAAAESFSTFIRMATERVKDFKSELLSESSRGEESPTVSDEEAIAMDMESEKHEDRITVLDGREVSIPLQGLSRAPVTLQTLQQAVKQATAEPEFVDSLSEVPRSLAAQPVAAPAEEPEDNVFHDADDDARFYDARELPGDPVPALMNRLQIELSILKTQISTLYSRLLGVEKSNSSLSQSQQSQSQSHSLSLRPEAAEQALLARMDDVTDHLRATERRSRERERLLHQRLLELERALQAHRRWTWIGGALTVVVLFVWPLLLRGWPRLHK